MHAIHALCVNTTPPASWENGATDECTNAKPWNKLVKPWLKSKNTSVVILLGDKVGDIGEQPPTDWPGNDVLKLVGLAKQQDAKLTVLSTRMTDDTFAPSKEPPANWHHLYGTITEGILAPDQDTANFANVVAASEYIQNKHAQSHVLVIAIGIDFADCGDGPRTVLNQLMDTTFQDIPTLQQLLMIHAPFEEDKPPQQMFEQAQSDLKDYFKHMFR